MKIVYSDFVFAAKMSDLTVIAQSMELAKRQSFVILFYTCLNIMHAIEPNEMTTGMGLQNN
jgi:hypothetical protein